MVARCAATAFGDLVNTFMPSVTGVAQAGSGFGAFSTSTRHMRQLAATRELVVIAEARNVDVRRVRDLHDHLTLAGLQRHAVDFDIDRIVAHRPYAATAGRPSSASRLR